MTTPPNVEAEIGKTADKPFCKFCAMGVSGTSNTSEKIANFMDKAAGELQAQSPRPRPPMLRGMPRATQPEPQPSGGRALETLSQKQP